MYDSLHAHDLALLSYSSEVCLCAERCCTLGQRVSLYFTMDGQSQAYLASDTSLPCRRPGPPRVHGSRRGLHPRQSNPLDLPFK